MSRILLGIYFLIFVLIGVNLLFLIQGISKPEILDDSAIKSQNAHFKEVTYENKKFSYAVFTIQRGESLWLIYNSKKEESIDVVKNNQCSKAINGGYYVEGGSPLGLLTINGENISERINSPTMNSFIYPDTKGILGIYPDMDELTFSPLVALQNGPMLVFNGEALNLNIANDKPARRSVAFTVSNHIYFAIIFDTKSVFEGPYLEELPFVLQDIADNEGYDVQNAMNLDGGSASMFKSKEAYLNEFKMVGAIICIK